MPFTIEDVSKHRSVNGEEVLLSDAERQAIADEWNANAARAPRPRTLPVDSIISDPQQLAALKAALAK